MAGTHTRSMVTVEGDSRFVATYTFAYGDEWDGWDWDNYDPRADGAPNELLFDLVGNAVVNVIDTGPASTWFAGIYRWQGNSPSLWRSGTFTAANTPQSFPVGSGPNPRVVGDIARNEIRRTA